MIVHFMSVIAGLGIGLCAGLELARRAYRDTADRLARSNEILAKVYADLDATRPEA